MDLLTIFLTGLLTGGLSCLAVQGGLLATVIAKREEEDIEKKGKIKEDLLPVVSFLVTKLAAYTLLGFLLGLFGSFFKLSITTTIILQIGIGLFMLGTALNILNIHPIFRYFVIQPPKFLMKITYKQSKNKDIFTPGILGAFTVFIPCGVTQAMMALAVGSSNPFSGAMIMFIFILGTSPLFFILGYFATKLGETLQKKFMKIASFAIILLAIYTINQALVLSGSSYNFQNLYCKILSCENVNSRSVSNGNQKTQIIITDSGYNPDRIDVKKGSHVVLELVNSGAKGCIQSFVIPKLGIQTTVQYNTSKIIEFDAPNSEEQIIFTCSMGMYVGTINVK